VVVLAGESDAVLDAKFPAASGFQPCSTILRILRAGSLRATVTIAHARIETEYRGILEWVYSPTCGHEFLVCGWQLSSVPFCFSISANQVCKAGLVFEVYIVFSADCARFETGMYKDET
jgi:hypothetical protein